MSSNTPNVVMMVWKRDKVFAKILESFAKQTIKFKLHVISNNPELHDKFLETINDFRSMQGMDIEFFRGDNSKRTAERWHYVKNNLLNEEYTIFIDDDMELHPDSLEKLWESREKNTMKVKEGRKFRIKDEEITKHVFSASIGSHHKEFSYGALNFGIVDNVYFQPNSEIFKKEQEDPKVCYDADDLVVSWAVNKMGGKILNHQINPAREHGHDSFAVHKEIRDWIYKNYAILDSQHRFKRFE